MNQSKWLTKEAFDPKKKEKRLLMAPGLYDPKGEPEGQPTHETQYGNPYHVSGTGGEVGTGGQPGINTGMVPASTGQGGS